MEPRRVESGELTAEEIIEELTAGRRLLVSVDRFGGDHEISLRYDGETYYCDTPTRLHRHADPDEMRACIERMGYGR